MSIQSFSQLNLNPDLLSNLETLGYLQMTPIQAKSLPFVLAGRDVVAQGQTGSGKTAAFGLGLLNKLRVKQFRIQQLVLCPTRELADQVAKEIRRLARATHNIKVLTLCGGMSIGPQIGSLEHGAHIIVGTPGRITDHLRKKTLNLENVDTLVLDEADRMLDMGFQDQLDAIVDEMPGSRQTLLFSATFPDQIQKMAKRIAKNPEFIEVEAEAQHLDIQQQFYTVKNNADRFSSIDVLLRHYQPESALVFCNTKKDTQDVAGELRRLGCAALALHGDLDQKDRDRTLVLFSNKSIPVLVATDVAARGLDVEGLDLVVNFHMTRDPEVHTHRVGRTGRAGKAGLACSFFSANEAQKVALIPLDSDPVLSPDKLPSVNDQAELPQPAMTTIQIDGGKKQKVRPGDILGALTGENGLEGRKVGKISIYANSAFVAVERDVEKRALKILGEGKLKGRSFRVRVVKK